MLVTKHLAELCALVVNGVCGEIPSRVLGILFIRGRSTIGQLVLHTSLPPRQLKHGLVVLAQQNLLYHQTNKETRITSYQANPEACYDILRVGKFLDMIAEQHGPVSEEVARSLMLLGHHRIEILEELVVDKGVEPTDEGGGTAEEYVGGLSGCVRTTSQLHQTLQGLIDADLLDVVGPRTFRSPEDIRREIEHELSVSMSGEKPARSKAEQQRALSQRLLEAQQESNNLKRLLRQASGHSVKRRRIETGDGHSADDDDGFRLDQHVTIRLNHDKCLVELRNRSLARFAADAVGETSGEVFYSLLTILATKIPKCGAVEDTGGSGNSQLKATTLEILQHLDPHVDIFRGIGKAKREEIDLVGIEKTRTSPGPEDADSDESDDNHDGGATFDDSEMDSDTESRHNGPPLGESPHLSDSQLATDMDVVGLRLGFDDKVGQLRQHLFLLKESKQKFVRFCGRQDYGLWTVDFPQLMERLRQAEMDSVIEQSFGHQGLRLVRLLRAKGKMDERALPAASMMKKSEVQSKMLAMQLGGIVEVQEVPKDNSRLANRTLFFWFFDHDRCRSQLLDRFYKTMLRCLQVLEVHREKEKMLLAFVEREDVRGKEEEVMSSEHFERYTAHLELQQKLIGQVMRLDEAVAILRDY